MSGDSYTYQFATAKQTVNGQTTDVIVRDANGIPKPLLDSAGKPVQYTISYPEHDDKGNFLSHPSAGSVISIHSFGWMFVQANLAILILVGFESVTSMGGEARNAKRDIPIAVIVSLLVQGCFCYFFEYFAANYVLNSGYTMQTATGSAAPIGDLMIMVGNTIFGPGNGRIFMLAEAFTVFLALIGTTLSCMNTGARVTYAMGKDDELSAGLGSLHHKTLTPHRAIWTLAAIAAVLGCLGVAVLLELRYVPALRVELRGLHGGLSQPPELQLPQASGHPGLRTAGEPDLLGFLSGWTVHGLRHQAGAFNRFRGRGCLGYLRRTLFHPLQ
jgi:APA family basic amino acid/polyamine antiporter